MKNRSKTSLFLMEVILSILLFSVCSTICVRLFVQAQRTEQKARDLTHASLLCDSIAAILQNTESPEVLFSFFPGSDLREACVDNGLLWEGCYNAAWQPCATEDAHWILLLTPDSAAFASPSFSSRQALLSVYSAIECEDLSKETVSRQQDPFYELHIGY